MARYLPGTGKSKNLLTFVTANVGDVIEFKSRGRRTKGVLVKKTTANLKVEGVNGNVPNAHFLGLAVENFLLDPVTFFTMSRRMVPQVFDLADYDNQVPVEYSLINGPTTFASATVAEAVEEARVVDVADEPVVETVVFLPLKAAAAALGFSTDALRKRGTRGTHETRVVDGVTQYRI